MKHFTLPFAFVLAVCLISACDKDESYESMKGIPVSQPTIVSYEANWVVDHLVIDKTRLDYIYYDYDSHIDDTGIQFWHMPNQLLLQDVLSIDQWKLPFYDVNALCIPIQNLGYNSSTTFFEKKTSGSFTSDPYDKRYSIKNGEEVYSISLACQIDGAYEQNADQWTIKMTVDKLSVYSVSADSVISNHTFDPALTLMLISTKRLN